MLESHREEAARDRVRRPWLPGRWSFRAMRGVALIAVETTDLVFALGSIVAGGAVAASLPRDRARRRPADEQQGPAHR